MIVGRGWRRRHRDRRGFTLLEIIIALGLGVVIVGVLGALFLFSFRTWQRGADLREVQIQAAIIVDAVARDLRAAGRGAGVTTAPPLAVNLGRPLVAVTAPGAGEGGAALWILYALDEERGDLYRLLVLLTASDAMEVRSTRLVGRGVRRLEIVPAPGGSTVDVEVARGQAAARLRRTAAALNP